MVNDVKFKFALISDLSAPIFIDLALYDGDCELKARMLF